jgi:amino acid adenylation domain-containing protein
MSVAEFVSDLRKLDVRLSVNGQRLRVNAPKGVLTDSLRAQIGERKQELLQFLSDYEQSGALIPPAILRRTSSDPAPLSFAQERLWFLEQLESGSAVYNICRASRLIGQLNIAALEASLSEILRRHEILRSQIRIVDAHPVQVAVAVPRFEVPVIDLRSLTEAERDQEVRDRIKAEAEWQFDFSAGLFVRAVLLQLSDDEHILILTTHHIVADAWSMGILTREVWTLYDAYAKGNPLDREDLPIQYADYAAWQRQWLQGDVLESQLSYWKEQLKELSILNCPTDYPRPVKQSFRGARQSLSLPESLTKAVNELSGREGVTQFMTLLAAFQVLLYRYSGQEDVVVGSPIANRNRTEIERLIGFFVNTLVLRSDCSGSPSFREFLLRVRDVCLGAYAHQDLPFEKLVEELRPERDLSRNPLFQVLFVLQNTPRPLPQPTGLSIERVDVLPATSLFDLSLYLREREGKLIGFVEYNTDLFESATIERMIGHFETLLKGFVADPEQPIATLPLLTEAERHQLLVEWNNTETEYPKNACIHELFEAQAAKTPESIALECEGKQLTYGELNRRANQLAHYLRSLGIGPERLVGICIERSMEMVIGLLGILKAGGAYVPLDPSYPRERLAFMLDDSQASVLLTSERIIERLKIGASDSRSSILDPQTKVVCLDTNWGTIVRESPQSNRSEVKPDNLAYVIYTSGSTGQPKGVAIEHRNTGALLYWAKSVFKGNELLGVLASTSICFDLSVFELFVPLSWGGKIILAENALHLHSMPEKNDVTLINTVPSVMTELLAIGNLPDSVRTINLAGEPLRSELVKEIYECGNVEKVYDLYGPSETTTYSTFTLRTAEGPPTIGRPISNTRIYILDENLQPVPIGIPGELYIGGAGVAREYLNRPDLTAERFSPSPFTTNTSDRLYRTGDVARYRPDGSIEFLGRVDNQVKIRGYRIELGEIEAVLNQHPAVKDGVVVVRERDSSAEKNLVSYVVPRQQSPYLVPELRNFLKRKLPEYMVPSVFVTLEMLPLMPNGKVDRQKLPRLDDARPQPSRQFVAPRTEIEELIAQTWREVLKIENVGIFENFFELGGHSLLATQIVARLQEAFNKDVPLRVLFDAPTIAELARELETIIGDGRAPELPPIVPVPRDGPLPLSLNQEQLWRLHQMMPGTHFFNMPYVYQLSGDLNVEALERALKEIMRRHEALRTVFEGIDGRPAQVIKPVPCSALVVVDLRLADREDLTQKATDSILGERFQSFDLAEGPLIRAKLLRLTDRENLLLITAHHIIADHWSMQVFRRELIALYEAFCHGKSSPLPEPTIQFGDYACWERRLLDDGLFNDQLVYWKNQLAGALTGSQDQASRDNNAEPSFQFNRQAIEIKGGLLAELRLLAKKENTTLFIVLLAALIATLHVTTGQREIRVGTLVANRRRREIETTIGHFVNTMILSAQVSPELELKQLLDQIRDITLRAHTHQEFPMEQLMRELESKRQIDRASLFRVLINYQKHDSKPMNATGLTFASWNVPYRNSEVEALPTAFDLILNLKETSTMLTGTVNVRIAAVNGSGAADVANEFTGILKIMVSELERLISKLPVILTAET